MSLLGKLMPHGKSGFGYGSTSTEIASGIDLTGQTWILTGCTSGIGANTLEVLVKQGAHVVCLARAQEKAEAAGKAVGPETTGIGCELAEPASVRSAVASIRDLNRPIDGIICNAGIMMLPKRTVVHGLELQFLTNHVGHFILVTGLLDLLTDAARVVMLSSYGHTMTYRQGIRLDDLDAAGGYSATGAYGQSKLANLLFANELATRLPKPDQRAHSVHPGVIATNLGRHLPTVAQVGFKAVGNLLTNKTVPQGAATTLYAAIHPDGATTNGTYFADCNVARPSKYGRDAELAKRLWERTEELVAQL
jgi:WW domain-containing oxidoreductase